MAAIENREEIYLALEVFYEINSALAKVEEAIALLLAPEAYHEIKISGTTKVERPKIEKLELKVIVSGMADNITGPKGPIDVMSTPDVVEEGVYDDFRLEILTSCRKYLVLQLSNQEAYLKSIGI